MGVPPSIVEELPVYNGTIAASLTFRCLVRGSPRPEIIWYHNGVQFNNSYTRYLTSAHELRIPSFDPDESGIYQCFARNIFGEVYTSGELRLRSEDAILRNPLRNIKCYPHSYNSINVTFDNPEEAVNKTNMIFFIILLLFIVFVDFFSRVYL